MDRKARIVVTSNARADLDGYACSIGYAEFLSHLVNGVEAIRIDEPQNEVDFVLDYLGLKKIPDFRGSLSDYESLIIVDTSNLDSLRLEFDPQILSEIIDHRMVNDSHLYPWAKVQIEQVGSCATLIAEKFMQNNIVPSKESAVLLFGAIASNTINFKNKITTDRDVESAKYLKSLVEIPEDFVERMFRDKSDLEGEKLAEYLHQDFFEQEIFGHKFTIFQMEIVDTKDLVGKRLEEIKKAIAEILKNISLEFSFLNIIDTLEGYNYILATDKNTEDLLSKVLNLKFEQGLAKTDYIIMRKEITYKIKEFLGKTQK